MLWVHFSCLHLQLPGEENHGGVNLGYTDTAHKHAVTTWNGVVRYQYDPAGNMTSRVDGSTFAQEWNEDNRLTKVTVNGLVTQFFYDADGTLIKEFGSDQKITVTVGSHYEWDNATNAGKTRSFYFFNGQRIAVRERNEAVPNNDAITFYHPDHLGSINAVTGSGGSTLAQMRYKPWGEKRWTDKVCKVCKVQTVE